MVAIVGYTNAGKSTLFNALTRRRCWRENKLFATLDPTTRHITLPTHQEVLLTDTVGFIQKLPTTLVAAFRARWRRWSRPICCSKWWTRRTRTPSSRARR